MTTALDNNLIGPFPIDTPPVRPGFYAVTLNGTHGVKQLAYFDMSNWFDSDDGLSDPINAPSIKAWYGSMTPPKETQVVEDDGLGV
jgi:hypothetical protein